jgi:hypothetical protein
MGLAIGQLWENALVHCHLPSYVGSRESSRPFFVGPSPSLPRRRQYMRNYFWWAMDITEAWEKANRPIAEALVCQCYADTGDDEIESAFQEYMEDSFLWDMACEYLTNIYRFFWTDKFVQSYQCFQRSRLRSLGRSPGTA